MPVSRELRVYAHRGASLAEPENTLAAFRRGLEEGATALELDVRRTRDGHFVVCHDPDGLRTAGRGERVRDLDLSRVKRWDAGHGFVDREGGHPHRGRGHSVPTLVEVLDAFPGVPLCVEVKLDDLGSVPPLLELLAGHGAEGRVTLASFHDRLVGRIRALGYPGRTALTRGEVALLRLLPEALARRLVRGDAAHVPLRQGPLRFDGVPFLGRCRRLGLRAELWTVNDPGVARDLVGRGATGIMTDDPGRIAAALEGVVGCPW